MNGPRNSNNDRIPYCEVETADGVIKFPNATVDCFEIGEATVTRLSDEMDLWVFPPGTWSGYTAYDRYHHVLFSVHLAAVPVRVVMLPEARTA